MERPTRPRLPSAPKPRQRVLRPKEVEKLLEAARADDLRLGRSFALALIRLLSGSGACVSEVLALEWGEQGLDLRTEPPVMRIQQSKTDAGVRDVWLDAETGRSRAPITARRASRATARPCSDEAAASAPTGSGSRAPRSAALPTQPACRVSLRTSFDIRT